MEFLHREIPALGGRRVFRLGVAANYGLDADGIKAALDRGVNYFLYTGLRSRQMRAPLRSAFAGQRDKVVVAGGTTLGWFGGSVRRGAERTLKSLGVDHLDIYQLSWLGVASALTDATLRELRHLKESGKVRALGVSIHDRVRAGRLAEDSAFDQLMIRYNAAHPGAERDIFPHLARRRPMVVAYTATRWRKLLRRPGGWTGAVMTAGDCYRFCLSHPAVDVVLCAPANRAQLDENLTAVARGPLSDDESRWMRAFGQAVHG